ncbi:hypothetical protein GCM10018790_80220 [Kitasatospora xanthocidica]|nr:hypothetical protein GCM10018790_80220 [Kitasatospora xanthocidica]
MPPVLAPAVGAGEEIGQEASGGVAEATVLEKAVRKYGETARVSATMNLHWELLLLVPDPGVL